MDQYFPEEKLTEVRGNIQILLGLNIIQYHPVPIQSCVCVGKCVGGFVSTDQLDLAKVNFTQVTGSLDNFFNSESLGVSCTPNCGSCRCGNCALGSSQNSTKEQKELELIEKGLSIDDCVWTVKYPWVKEPKALPNNRHYAEQLLYSTERRLLRNDKQAKVY